MDFPITITNKAADQILHLIDKNGSVDNIFLRVSVKSGGCSGMSYSMAFTKDQADQYDLTTTLSNNVKVFIDPKSALYIQGVELDYNDDLMDSGFRFNNPQAKKVCACGESFST